MKKFLKKRYYKKEARKRGVDVETFRQFDMARETSKLPQTIKG